MKRHIIEILLQEIVMEVRVGNILKEEPLFDTVVRNLELRKDQQELTPSELETLLYLRSVDERRPEYKFDLHKPLQDELEELMRPMEKARGEAPYSIKYMEIGAKVTKDHISKDGKVFAFEAGGEFWVILEELDESVMMGDGDSGEGEGFPTGFYFLIRLNDIDDSEADLPEHMTLEEIDKWLNEPTEGP
jgi:hypothetical protein